MMVFINVIFKTPTGISLIICYLDLLSLTGYCAVTGSSWSRAHIYEKIKDTVKTKSGACSDKENQKGPRLVPDWSSVVLKIKSDVVVGFHTGQYGFELCCSHLWKVMWTRPAGVSVAADVDDGSA